MTVPRPVIRRVAVAGRVTDAHTSRPLADAMVQLHRADKRISWTSSAADGLFYFVGIAPGEYSLEVTYPSMGARYGKASQNVAVPVIPEDAAFSFRSVVFLSVPLQPWVIQGRISEKGQSPVVMAEVVLKGSGERCFSDANGQYALIAVEPAKAEVGRTVQVFAQGYKPTSKTAMVDQTSASFQPLDFELERPAGRSAGKVRGQG